MRNLHEVRFVNASLKSFLTESASIAGMGNFGLKKKPKPKHLNLYWEQNFVIAEYVPVHFDRSLPDGG